MDIPTLKRILDAPLDAVGPLAITGWTVECQGYNPELREETWFEIHDFGLDYESGTIILFLKYDYGY